MPEYEGSLRMPGEPGPGISIRVDLDAEHLTVNAGNGPIGSWPLSDVRVNAGIDGFHLRAEGEEVILDITDDARFALDLGLRSAPPLLRRKMAAILRET